MSSFHVILTGSNDELGSYLLEVLSRNETVKTITCLKPLPDPKAPKATTERPTGQGSRVSIPLHEKVQFLQCDLSKPDLDIEAGTNQALRATVNLVIHNDWPSDPGRPFSYFHPHLLGVKNLINFVNKCTHGTKLCFISSASVAGRWAALSGASSKIPEVVLEDWRLATPGYGQSKLVAERLIAEATRSLGIDGVICRLGQVTGPARNDHYGLANSRDWFPSMIRSSIVLGALPATLGPLDDIDWMPVDTCAEILVQLQIQTGLENDERRRWGRKGRRDGKTIQVHHLTNPYTTPYSSLVKIIQDTLSENIKIIPLSEWIDLLEKSANQKDNTNAKMIEPSQSPAQPELADTSSKDMRVDAIPALKSITFFKELEMRARVVPSARAPRLETKLTASKSTILREMRAVEQVEVKNWLRQWGIVRFERA
ncbi:hypothetical protein H2200_010286 [Cladophialophora chaetospira]|uniref:Thioester reductase (TE) domain-containing protein n=1 Tax=Cladophialophora chaetospira TaxID=386627 RepID=A0AA39CE62_9EURO|nr:hypothetical protein H2200_010286 [Cladophialophora chaetospira]